MIHEVDAALRGVLTEEALRGSGIEVAMEAPTKEWAARRTAPTVNAYLYDVTEELKLRGQGEMQMRDERGVVVQERRPPRWYRLAYLVTAWTARAEDEHRLLSAVLGQLMRLEVLPSGRLGPILSSAEESVRVHVAMRGENERPSMDLWTALGGELKPSLEVVVIAPFPFGANVDVAPPVTEIEVQARSMDGEQVDRPRIGPRDRDGSGAAAIAGAGGGAAEKARSGVDLGSVFGPGTGPAAGTGTGTGPRSAPESGTAAGAGSGAGSGAGAGAGSGSAFGADAADGKGGGLLGFGGGRRMRRKAGPGPGTGSAPGSGDGGSGPGASGDGGGDGGASGDGGGDGRGGGGRNDDGRNDDGTNGGHGNGRGRER